MIVWARASDDLITAQNPFRSNDHPISIINIILRHDKEAIDHQERWLERAPDRLLLLFNSTPLDSSRTTRIGSTLLSVVSWNTWKQKRNCDIRSRLIVIYGESSVRR